MADPNIVFGGQGGSFYDRLQEQQVAKERNLILSRQLEQAKINAENQRYADELTSALSAQKLAVTPDQKKLATQKVFQLAFRMDDAEIEEVFASRPLADIENIQKEVDKKIAGDVKQHQAGKLSQADLSSRIQGYLSSAEQALMGGGQYAPPPPPPERGMTDSDVEGVPQINADTGATDTAVEAQAPPGSDMAVQQEAIATAQEQAPKVSKKLGVSNEAARNYLLAKDGDPFIQGSEVAFPIEGKVGTDMFFESLDGVLGQMAEIAKSGAMTPKELSQWVALSLADAGVDVQTVERNGEKMRVIRDPGIRRFVKQVFASTIIPAAEGK